MKEFSKFLQLVGTGTPDLVSLLLCPALLVVAGLLLAVFHKKKAYPPLAVGLGAAAVFLVGCEVGAAGELFVYAAMYVALSVLVSLLFLIPFPTGKNRKEREDVMYEKFHVGLDLPEEGEEEEKTCGEEECGPRLDHALSMLEKLQKCNLSPCDRLEIDSLGRKLEGCKGRALTQEELGSVNDCLATVLKLTAKYKL